MQLGDGTQPLSNTSQSLGGMQPGGTHAPSEQAASPVAPERPVAEVTPPALPSAAGPSVQVGFYPATTVTTKRPGPHAFAPAAKKAQYSTPYNDFYQEQRPLLPAGMRHADREKLMGQKWKALTDLERAAYKVGAAASPTPYHVFCQERRPLLPKGLSKKETEKLLGQMWKAQNGTERAEYQVGGRDWQSSPQGSALPLAAPARAPAPVLVAPATSRAVSAAEAAWSKVDDHRNIPPALTPNP